MEKPDSVSNNSSCELNTENLTLDTLETPSKQNSEGPDMKQPGKNANAKVHISKADAGNGTGSDSDASKDEDITFKPGFLAAAAAQLAAETSQQNSAKIFEIPRVQNTESMQDDGKEEEKHNIDDDAIKQISDDLNKNELKGRGIGTEDEDPLVIDEAGDDDTKSESDMAGGSEVEYI